MTGEFRAVASVRSLMFGGKIAVNRETTFSPNQAASHGPGGVVETMSALLQSMGPWECSVDPITPGYCPSFAFLRKVGGEGDLNAAIVRLRVEGCSDSVRARLFLDATSAGGARS